MIFKIFVIFLITFTPINTTPCLDSPTCKCSSTKSDELNIVCDVENITAYTVNIKSRNNIQGRLSEKRIQSLNFKNCGLSNDTTLRNVVKQLGVRDTHTLIFKSFKNLSGRLKRHNLQGFESVKSVVLSDNGLIDISNNLLLDFPELEHIDLSNNNLELPNDIFDATPNLKKIELVSKSFDELVCLTSLNLANNLLSELLSNIFHKLKNLKMLDISMNNFTFLPAKFFDQNKELREFYLHNNTIKISTLPDNLLANLTKLHYVQLNGNGFLFLPENLFWGSSSLEYIFLSENSLVTLPKKIFRGLNKVKKLSLKNNEIETLPSKIFEDMEELKILDLSNNRIARVSRNLFLGMSHLYKLNMKRNRLQFIHKEAFVPFTNLRIAMLSHNPLKLSYVNGKLSVFFTNQYLEELHLANSSIYHFSDEWFSGNDNLKFLDLTYNFISNITFEEMADKRKENHAIVIRLAHNPILCGCPLYDLLLYREGKMSRRINKYFIKVGNLKCIQSDGKNVTKVSQLSSKTYKCLQHEYFYTENRCQNNCSCYIRPSDLSQSVDC
ncbi:leucine-rich repeat-containing protein 15-like [Polistes fuscatus]|uniref:leucine-rich repeat-containing protein 15-like n=1 Tax=Polistes fuscatus TaxID=30207 RepID=UPI001CA8F864|nr:leucine-rich repeat-containing protein 15-like [Polistes fuscatus]